MKRWTVSALSAGTQEDVDLAVGTARKAYEEWSKLPGHVRARHLYSVARHVQKHARYVWPQWHRGITFSLLSLSLPLAPLSLSSYFYHPPSLHSRLLSVLESLDNGKSIRESRDCDIPLVARHFYHHAGKPHPLTTPTRTYPLRHTGWAQLMETEMQGWASIGVVAAIVPWNFPLMLLTWKVTSYLNMSYDGHVTVM